MKLTKTQIQALENMKNNIATMKTEETKLMPGRVFNADGSEKLTGKLYHTGINLNTIAALRDKGAIKCNGFYLGGKVVDLEIM